MELEKVAAALKSKTRLRIIKILVQGDLSAINVYRKYNEIYKDRKHRETIYRDLELLTKNGVLNKEYNNTEKQIVYGIKNKRLIIDLINQKVSGE